MIRFYRTLAKVVTIYALLHPFAYLGAQWYEMRRIQEKAVSGWTAYSAEAGLNSKFEIGDDTPLLFQELIFERVFSIRNILLTLVMALGLIGVGAIFHIAASVMVLAQSRTQLADANARNIQRPPGDPDAG